MSMGEIMETEAIVSMKVRISLVSTRLKELIEPDYGLLDELLKLGFLTYPEYSDVRSEKTAYRKACSLLDLLATKPDDQCGLFKYALKNSDQEHVLNYIENPDGPQATGDNRPLEPSRLIHITSNTPRLIELIESDAGFLADLLAAGCITQRQKNDLSEIPKSSERNTTLLDIMRRRSVAHLGKFVSCLAENHQTHLVPLLLERGVIARVDATLDGADGVPVSEQQIVEQFKLIMLGDSDKDEQRVLSRGVEELRKIARSCGRDVELVVLRRTNSIGSYFFCRSRQSLQRMYSMCSDKNLCQFLETIFNFLLTGSEKVNVKCLLWRHDDYESCVDYFNKLPGRLVRLVSLAT